MQTSKPSKIQLPPKKEIDENKIKNVINKGGSPASYEQSDVPEVIKNFNVKMTEEDLQIVSILCKKRPSKLGRKLSFAKQDWFLEAVREKIERERKEYNI